MSEEAVHGGIKPAVAVVHSTRYTGKKNTRSLAIGFNDEVDAREKAEPVRQRHYYPFEQLLNEAVGHSIWCLNWHLPEWKVGKEDFTISRWYQAARVAFDFANTEAEEEGAGARKIVLNKQGIVHIYFARNAVMDVEQIKLEIARQRAEVN